MHATFDDDESPTPVFWLDIGRTIRSDRGTKFEKIEKNS